MRNRIPRARQKINHASCLPFGPASALPSGHIRQGYAHPTGALNPGRIAAQSARFIFCRTLVGLLVLTCTQAHAQEAEDRGNWGLFPAIAYAPEMSLLLGAIVLRTFRLEAPPPASEGPRPRKSSVTLLAAYTLKNQFLGTVKPNVYLDGERWQITGELAGIHFPDRLYPEGPDSPDDAEEYTRRSFVLAAAVSRRIVGPLRAGLTARALRSENSEYEPDGLIGTDQVRGSDGGTLLGVGPLLLWDDRDDNFAPRRGQRLEASAYSHEEAWGSDFPFTLYRLDLRQYVTLTGEHVIAGQVLGLFSTGDVPIQSMPMLGGSVNMRGFYAGRFRDRHLLTAQAAYRFPIGWRFTGSAFVGAGDVSHTLADFELAGVEIAGGAGFRYRLNPKERAAVRFDLAGTSRGDVNFYVDFGEAF